MSSATLSRWIAWGCPYQRKQHSRKHLFSLCDVETWLEREGHQKTSRGFPSRRRLKRYWIFDWEGRYVETVSGSRNAYDSITYYGRDEFYKARSCAIDETGREYIAYGGKLRRYNPQLHNDEIDWNESDIEQPEDDM